MYGQIIGITGIDVGPYVRSYEETLVEKNALVTGFAVRRRALGVEMVKMDVAHIAGIGPAA